ncbi:MAG: hypothetical protein PHZ03_02330, partial [Syntrophomonas sp.]|nr:hypothetical protein [Syntrophomonas sp.]
DVAELADAPDLGSGAARRGGSSPLIRTIRNLEAFGPLYFLPIYRLSAKKCKMLLFFGMIGRNTCLNISI